MPYQCVVHSLRDLCRQQLFNRLKYATSLVVLVTLALVAWRIVCRERIISEACHLWCSQLFVEISHATAQLWACRARCLSLGWSVLGHTHHVVSWWRDWRCQMRCSTRWCATWHRHWGREVIRGSRCWQVFGTRRYFRLIYARVKNRALNSECLARTYQRVHRD